MGYMGCWGDGRLMSSQVVTYRVDDATTVRFEIEPPEGFRPAGPEEVLGRVGDAVGPAVEAAKAVLEKVKELRPEGVEVKFGVKVSGGANWLIAKAAGEANFEVTLAWSGDGHEAGAGQA
jgi:NTP-dependent ternary system trypsin peptidase co-occuring protein